MRVSRVCLEPILPVTAQEALDELHSQGGVQAEAYGEDQSFISRIERMQRRLDVLEFTVFCRILQVDPGDFLRPVWLAVPRPEGDEGP